jgi:hypothetical protein
MRVRLAHLAAALYRCPVGAAVEALRDTPFTPLVVAGRACSALVLVRCLDADLGAYDEVGVSVAVRGPDGRPGLYTLHFPVTNPTVETLTARAWGLPRFAVDATVVVESRQTRLELSAGEEFILAGSFPAGVPLPGRFSARTRSYSLGMAGEDCGRPLAFQTRARVSGVRVRAGGRPLQLGQHPMALTARSLGMADVPVLTVTARHAQFLLSGPEPV